jgi:hypothetical protein
MPGSFSKITVATPRRSRVTWGSATWLCTRANGRGSRHGPAAGRRTDMILGPSWYTTTMRPRLLSATDGNRSSSVGRARAMTRAGSHPCPGARRAACRVFPLNQTATARPRETMATSCSSLDDALPRRTGGRQPSPSALVRVCDEFPIAAAMGNRHKQAAAQATALLAPRVMPSVCSGTSGVGGGTRPGVRHGVGPERHHGGTDLAGHPLRRQPGAPHPPAASPT